MSEERFLVTGALGCIGASAVKQLVDEHVPVWTYDLGGSTHRLNLIMNAAAFAQVNLISGDVTDLAALEKAIVDNGITHVIHLAAFQVPFVRADPIGGARVNVVGTTTVLEAVRRHQDQVQQLVYASSVAAYGPPDAPFEPSTLYGVQKRADEGTARLYYEDYGVSSIGLRPHTVYGPGRDQGLTSSPTKAMLAAAVGQEYEITYGGNSIFHHTDDIAGVFIQAARTQIEGAMVYDVGGSVASMDDIVSTINAIVPESTDRITFVAEALSARWQLNTAPLETAIGAINWTPLTEGVSKTIEHLRSAMQAGTIDSDKVLSD